MTPELIAKHMEDHSPLLSEVTAGHQEVVSLLLEHGSEGISIEYGFWELLMLKNSVDMMKLILLREGTLFLSERSPPRSSPLHYATYKTI